MAIRFLLFQVVFLLQVFSAWSQELTIIPYPSKVERNTGNFVLNEKTVFYIDSSITDWKDQLNVLKENLLITSGYGIHISKKAVSENFILVKRLLGNYSSGSYKLDVFDKFVKIEAFDKEGLFYAIQTIKQLMKDDIEKTYLTKNRKWIIPQCKIEDEPRFKYRGLMLDVARHFLPVTFIKKMVDAMAMMKMNNLHLHLSDDQGWRIEIKKYPRLTEIGSVRNGTMIGRSPGIGNDNIVHSGYYSQNELRELVKYASERHINIIPELDLPGHSSAAIAAYPQLSCFPNEGSSVNKELVSQKAFEQATIHHAKIVQETWGVFNDVLCPSEYTFQFINDVMDEVMDVFPSNILHIGGDECPKENWKKSAFCQELIKKEHLKDEHELQSYFIKRLEKHINSKGRSIIGWDEILEGGLAPNATVMSWRGVNGGIESAKQNHEVIMTPIEFCYLNIYQSEDPTDSIAWGGLLPLNKVYNFDPVPKELNDDQKKYIIGIQGNLWTEYVNSPALAEFMIFPRISAIAETGWSQHKTGFIPFAKRLQSQFKRMKNLGINFSKHTYEIGYASRLMTSTNALKVELNGIVPIENLYYSINNQSIQKYKAPFEVSGAGNIKASVIINGIVTDQKTQPFVMVKSTGKSVSLDIQPDPLYTKGGNYAWANGFYGSNTRFNDNEWLGWNGKDFIGTIDFKKNEVIEKMSIRFFHSPNNWVYLPSKVEVFGSDDGEHFTLVSEKTIENKMNQNVQTVDISFKNISKRFLKVKAINHGLIENGNPGAGNPAWLFVDEVVVQ